VTLTPDQGQILQSLLTPPFKTLVPSGHNTGKTFCAAVAVNHWFDSYDPGVVITTAPTERDVVDLLWAEVRLLRQRAGLPSPFIGPRAAEMRTSEDHYAKGYTSTLGKSFQGRHRKRMLFIFDEATGVAPMYWQTLKTMFNADEGHAILAIFNPTDTTSAAYQEDSAIDTAEVPAWHRFRLSALNHPNILAELSGQRKPIPDAVSVAMVNEWTRDWCEPVGVDEIRELHGVRVRLKPADCQPGDIEWPPMSGKWFRPGPIFQCRALGQWPDTGSGVWSDWVWQLCFPDEEPAFDHGVLPCIGCDTAMGKGADFHAIHGRWCAVSIHHETSNTMDPPRILARLKAVAQLMADFANGQRDPASHPIDPKAIPIRIDDDGTGNAVTAFLQADGYNAQAIGAGTSADRPDLYPNKRSELWFAGAERAKIGRMCLSRLDKPTQRRLKAQLMAPEWDVDAAGRRVVEPKEYTKEKIGRSPDDGDSLNLAYYESTACGIEMVDIEQPQGGRSDRQQRPSGHPGRLR